jgi:hypothetical protein
MPTRLSRDINQAAFQMVRCSTEAEPKPSKSEISRVMAPMGKRGGKIGGKRRLETMTAEERREVARKAAESRWRSIPKAKDTDKGDLLFLCCDCSFGNASTPHFRENASRDSTGDRVYAPQAAIRLATRRS